jgi:hypothetical protein
MAYLLLAFLFAVPTAAFMDRSNGIHLFSLPELKTAKHRQLAANGHDGQGHRMLTRNEKGELPEVHDTGSFLGITDMGFVDFDHASITPPTTIISDDYLDLLASADFSCAPVPVPTAAENAAPVHRLTVTFPNGKPSDAEGLEHLVSRLSASNFFVYGVRTLLSHPALGAAADCVVHAGTANPYFAIVGASTSAGGGFTLALTPAMPAQVFAYMSMKLVFNPNITAEVARRRAAGMDLGDAQRLAEHEERGRRLPISFSQQLANFRVNWDGTKATTNKIGLLGASDTTSLYCNNCYFYLTAAVNLNLKVCAIIGSTPGASYTYYYDANVPVTQTYGHYTSSSCRTDDANKGCSSTGGDAAAKARTDCKSVADGGLGTPTPLTFDFGMSVEAFFEGSAGFNFEIKSDGISAAKGFPTTCTSGDSYACEAQTLPAPLNAPVVISTITVPVAGIPVTIDPTIQLKAAGWVNAQMPQFRLSFGASASVTAKLGGKVTFSKIGVTPTIVPYGTFTPQYSVLPFTMSGFTDAALSTDVMIVPVTKLTVWKLVPFVVEPKYQYKYNLAAKTARRLGYGAAARELQTCASGQAKSSAGVKGALGVTLEAVRTFAAVKAVTNVDLNAHPVLSSFNAELLPFTPIVNPANNEIAVTGALSTTAAGTCVKVGDTVSTGGSTSAGGGGGGGGGGASATSTSTGTLRFSGLPDSALTDIASTRLSIETAVRASAGTAGCGTDVGCTVTVTRIVNAGTGASLFAGTRRLAVGLTVTYTVTGPSAKVAAVTTEPSPAFTAALSGYITLLPGYSAVTVVVVSTPPAAAAAPDLALYIGLSVGLGVPILLAAAFLLYRRRQQQRQKEVGVLFFFSPASAF